MTPAFWQGKRVLVTGHTGFKGSWLSLWLQRCGAQVTGLALPPNDGDLFLTAKAGEGMQSLTGDVRDYAAVEKAVRDCKPEIVLHLAAQALVRASYDDPVGTYATNVMGAVHVLEAARRCDSVRVIVNVTSDKCYENREWVWGYRENEAMGGHDPYSSSKGCAELVTSAYRRSFAADGQVAIASARAGNVIGGGDWAKDRIIPDAMRALASGETLVLRNPHAVRPWQHVLEPLSGYLLLAEKLWQDKAKFAGGWNFGPAASDAKPVGWIVERLAAKSGGGLKWTVTDAAQPHEAQSLFLDSTKALTALGWQTRWPLDSALDAVTEWYQAWMSKNAMRAVTEKQIAAYEAASA